MPVEVIPKCKWLESDLFGRQGDPAMRLKMRGASGEVNEGGRRYAAFSFLVGSIANQHSTLAVSNYGSGFFLLEVLLYAQRMNSSPSGLAAFAFLLLPSRLLLPVMHPNRRTNRNAPKRTIGQPGGNTSDRRPSCSHHRTRPHACAPKGWVRQHLFLPRALLAYHDEGLAERPQSPTK